MKFGSICSGIEAASVAWHSIGWRAEWLAEIDTFPSAVLAHRFPDVPNVGDMMKVADMVANDNLPAPDVLVGGTPCQAFSVAGLRAGLSDERGALTLEFVRIANEIDKARTERGDQPAIIVWENVPGVLTSKDNAFGCFLAGLAGEDEPLQPAGKRWSDAGCVFGPQRTIAWRTLDAQFFGLAQRRRRVFVVASARNGFDPGQVLFEFEGVRRDFAPSREAGEVSAAGTLRSTDGGSCVDHARASHLVGTWWDGGQLSQTLDAVLYKGQTMPEKNRFPAVLQPIIAFPANLSGTQHASAEDLAPAMGAKNPTAIAFSAKDYGGDAIEELSPTLRAGGHTTSHANAGVMPAVCITGDVAHCLKAEGFDASEDGSGRGQPIVNAAARVRRLTPRECERLQGFPDDWTLISHRGKPAADGPRYKAIGNSMAVPVMRWIGWRIQQAVNSAANDNQQIEAAAS